MSEKADLIREYISDIATLPKEEPRKIRFTVLLASLYRLPIHELKKGVKLGDTFG